MPECQLRKSRLPARQRHPLGNDAGWRGRTEEKSSRRRTVLHFVVDGRKWHSDDSKLFVGRDRIRVNLVPNDGRPRGSEVRVTIRNIFQ